MSMSIGYHANITFGALKRWFVSQCYDSLAVAAMWLIALLVLHVPFAPLWALLAGALQFVPNFGLVLALIGPAMSILFTGAQWERFIGLLIAYALIAVIDGLLLQPYLMKRQNRVPWWASTFVPILMGFVIPFWGVLLAPPMLAVYYAYRKPTAPPPIRSGNGIILPPDRTR
jgi:predicted PurR-regulated permease PerM